MKREDKAQIYESLNRMSEDYSNFKKTIGKIFIYMISIKNLKRIKNIILFSLIFLPLITYISNSDNTYKYIEILVDETKVFMMGLFGIAFTGYALFQALTSGHTLTALLKTNENTSNKFEEFNLSFFSLNLLFLIITSANYILKIIIPIFKDMNLINYINFDKNVIIIVFIYLYIIFISYIIIEMRSFIFNLFQCFNFNAIAQGIKVLKENKEKPNKDE